jgi:ribose/xylose/arabinose/galactoside ABC-type transport system permease subunit
MKINTAFFKGCDRSIKAPVIAALVFGIGMWSLTSYMSQGQAVCSHGSNHTDCDFLAWFANGTRLMLVSFVGLSAAGITAAFQSLIDRSDERDDNKVFHI